MTYPCLPPEVNSALMQAGAGSAPMLAASSAWSGLAGELRAAADSFDSVTSNLSGGTWQDLQQRRWRPRPRRIPRG